MSLKTNRFYEFGNFRLDPAERILLCEDKPVSITPKVFETLQVFIEKPGHVFEKNELMKKIWQDRFVEESNLTFNIKMLRRALNDSASNPRFIETVPRRGYRFIAEVRETLPQEKIEAALPPAATAKPIRSQQSYLPLVALGLVLLCLSVVGSRWTQRNFSTSIPNTPILSAPFRSEKLTNTGAVNCAVISPDGKLVAYTDETNGRYGVWLRKLETSEIVQIIPPSEGLYIGLVFAHDGKTIYFVRESTGGQSQTAIYRVSIFGGIPEKILEKTQSWVSLSPDDRQISFVRCANKDEDFCSLMVADADGKNERKLLTRPRPIRISDSQFSPDGRSIAFAVGQSWNGTSDFRLMRFDLAGGTESEISPQTFFEITSLRWLPDGNELIFTARKSLDGNLNIWKVSTSSGEPRTITNDAANYHSLSLDKTAKQMIAIQVNNDFRLHLFSNGETSILTTAREATFAPDGKIIYVTNGDIWSMSADGSGQRQLTNNTFNDFSPRVSPDNRWIFFTSNRSGANQVWRMNIDGSDQTQLTRTEGGYPRFISPDGKWIYFKSGFHQTLWKIAADGGEETQIFEKRVMSPAFTPNGNLFAYFFRDEDNQFKIAVINSADQTILKTLVLANEKHYPVKMAWSNDNQTLNYIARSNSKNFLWQQSLDEAQPRFVADLGDKEISGFALAPDDKSFGFIRGKWLLDLVVIDGLK